MKGKITVLAVVVILFMLGFFGSGKLWGSAKSYEAGTRQNPLAAKSYLEESVLEKLEPMLKEVESLKNRVNDLQRLIK